MPGTPTTKYALPTMAGADAANTIDTYSASLATTVDGLLAPSDQGLFAARPPSTVGSPGKAGRTYMATDTGQLFRDNGTGWDEIPLAPIGTADLADGAVTSQKLKPTSGIVGSVGTGFALTNNAAWQDVPGLTLSITPVVASILLVDFSVLFNLGSASAAAGAESRLLLDGAEPAGSVRGHAECSIAGGGSIFVISAGVGRGRLALTAAAHTLKVQAKCWYSPNVNNSQTADVAPGYLSWLLHAS